MILRITFFLLILSVFHQTFSQTKNIIVFGDSISAAYGIDSSKGWVNILRERLADNTEDVTIINNDLITAKKESYNIVKNFLINE